MNPSSPEQLLSKAPIQKCVTAYQIVRTFIKYKVKFRRVKNKKVMIRSDIRYAAFIPTKNTSMATYEYGISINKTSYLLRLVSLTYLRAYFTSKTFFVIIKSNQSFFTPIVLIKKCFVKEQRTPSFLFLCYLF